MPVRVTTNVSDAPGSSDAASGSVSSKPAGSVTAPSESVPPPSLVTRNVRAAPAGWPATTAPKSTGCACPSASGVPTPPPPSSETAISGVMPFTVPATAKLYGFFAATLVAKLTSPAFAPAAVVGMRIVNVADPPAASEAGSPETTSNPPVALTVPSVTGSSPVLVTVNARCGAGWPAATAPKSVPSTPEGLTSPSPMIASPTDTVTSPGCTASIDAASV